MEYLIERFPEQTKALVPSTPEQRAKSRIPPRLLDVYVTPIQVRKPTQLPWTMLCLLP